MGEHKKEGGNRLRKTERTCRVLNRCPRARSGPELKHFLANQTDSSCLMARGSHKYQQSPSHPGSAVCTRGGSEGARWNISTVLCRKSMPVSDKASNQVGVGSNGVCRAWISSTHWEHDLALLPQ